MKGNRVTFVVLCIFAIQTKVMVNAVFTMAQTCQYVNGFIADPSNCEGWGFCKNGQLIETGNCPANFAFDVASGICNTPANSECRASPAQMCSTVGDRVLFTNPTNCSSYCICVSGQVECDSCPDVQVFHDGSCMYRDAPEYKPCPADSICRLIPNGVFAANPNACGGYELCMNGVGTPGTCATGSFNPLNGYCDPGYTPCTEETVVNPIQCETAETYIEDANNCGGYYYCVKASGTAVWGKCPTGLHFNPALSAASGSSQPACVSPISYACPHNRCGNMNVNFMTAIGTTCKGWIRCANGTAVSASPQNCPAEFPFFNEIRQGCVSESSDWAICRA